MDDSKKLLIVARENPFKEKASQAIAQMMRIRGGKDANNALLLCFFDGFYLNLYLAKDNITL